MPGDLMDVTAIVLINVKKGAVNEVAKELSKMDEIVEVHSVAGMYDLVAKVKVKEYERLSDIITEKMQTIDGIERTMTMLCFHTFKI
ncbi:MAG TPA: Lrp/AsnC family transcriptional regulator [Archaeoglobaceae archaeon]|nr:Lrp/AsnC family transcriptional regulator [Archaeoglobaceae archaeon]